MKKRPQLLYTSTYILSCLLGVFGTLMQVTWINKGWSSSARSKFFSFNFFWVIWQTADIHCKMCSLDKFFKRKFLDVSSASRSVNFRFREIFKSEFFCVILCYLYSMNIYSVSVQDTIFFSSFHCPWFWIIDTTWCFESLYSENEVCYFFIEILSFGESYFVQRN